MSNFSPDSISSLALTAVQDRLAAASLIEQQFHRLTELGSSAALPLSEALVKLRTELDNLRSETPDLADLMDLNMTSNQLRSLKKKVRMAVQGGRMTYNGRSIEWWRAWIAAQELRLYGAPEDRRGRPTKPL